MSIPPDAICHNCLEPLSYRGPDKRGDGDTAAAMLDAADRRIYLFCSVSCREWWWSKIGCNGYDAEGERQLYVSEFSLSEYLESDKITK